MKNLADLILGTGVITVDSMAAVQLPPPPPQGTASQQQQLASTGSSRDANGLRCNLLVTQQWIAAHASAIARVEAGELVVDGSHASRKLSVKLRDGAGETQVQVQYDVPAIETDREALRQMELMHRRREERALLVKQPFLLPFLKALHPHSRSATLHQVKISSRQEYRAGFTA